MEIDFLPMSCHQAGRQRRRRREALAAVVTTIAVVGVLIVGRYIRGDAGHAAIAQPPLNEPDSTLPADRVHWTLPSDIAVQGTPADAVFEQIRQLDVNTVSVQSIEIQSSLGGVVIRFDEHPAPTPGTGDKRADLPIPADEPARGCVIGLAPGEMQIGILIGRLSACPRVRDVRLTRSAETESNGQPMRGFRVAFVLLPEVSGPPAESEMQPSP